MLRSSAEVISEAAGRRQIITRLLQCRLTLQHPPKTDPVFLHVRAGMTVIVTDTEGAWRMADVIWVDGGARNPKVPTLFQVADVDTGVINWININLSELTRPIT